MGIATSYSDESRFLILAAICNGFHLVSVPTTLNMTSIRFHRHHTDKLCIFDWVDWICVVYNSPILSKSRWSANPVTNNTSTVGRTMKQAGLSSIASGCYGDISDGLHNMPSTTACAHTHYISKTAYYMANQMIAFTLIRFDLSMHEILSSKALHLSFIMCLQSVNVSNSNIYIYTHIYI